MTRKTDLCLFKVQHLSNMETQRIVGPINMYLYPGVKLALQRLLPELHPDCVVVEQWLKGTAPTDPADIHFSTDVRS